MKCNDFRLNCILWLPHFESDIDLDLLFTEWRPAEYATLGAVMRNLKFLEEWFKLVEIHETVINYILTCILEIDIMRNCSLLVMYFVLFCFIYCILDWVIKKVYCTNYILYFYTSGFDMLCVWCSWRKRFSPGSRYCCRTAEISPAKIPCPYYSMRDTL